jgi:hypothetical protein
VKLPLRHENLRGSRIIKDAENEIIAIVFPALGVNEWAREKTSREAETNAALLCKFANEAGEKMTAPKEEIIPKDLIDGLAADINKFFLGGKNED